MRVLTCVSFHGTGSSVVDDILKEFDNCVSAPSDIECRFLQDPDGISDLEYNLIDNPHRLNSGFAIKRYARFVKKFNHTYKFLFGNMWKKESMKYIDSLVSVRYKGFWYRDLEVIPKSEKLVYYFKRLINKILNLRRRVAGCYVNCDNVEFYHSNLSGNQFVELTRQYVKSLCEVLNKENKSFVLLDQCVPTSNIGRYKKYFDDIKVIVVDRDPRDTYIEHKRCKDHVLPNTPEEFCKVYRDHREVFAKSKEQVLYIRFEDFIFNYDDTLNKLISYIGQDEACHVYKKKYFNPEISIKNTRLWEKCPQYAKEIEVIEKNLPEYLYQY